MALNWAMLTPNRSPVPLPQEETLTAVEYGAELTLTIPNVPPSGSSASGGSGGAKTLKESGGIWLTNQRLIFVSPDSATKPSFDSLSVPLASILSTKFEQPYFGVNFLAFEVKPSPNGDLTEGTQAELRFKDRGMFQFVSILEKTRERAVYMKRQSLDDEEGLPVYTSPPQSTSSSSVAGVPIDSPPGYDA